MGLAPVEAHVGSGEAGGRAWRLVDGLVPSGDGWNSQVATSGLSAFHVTAADFLCGYPDGVTQIAAWRRRIDASSEHLFLVDTAEDVAQIGGDRVGVILGLQNARLIEEDVGRVDVLGQLGVRILQLTYNTANLIGDGCLEGRNAGLSRLGRRVVERCNEVGILVDLSHVGPRSVLDAVEASNGPVAITHANRHVLAPNPRNKPDDVIKAVAATGGIVGVTGHAVMNWEGGDRPTPASFARQVIGMLEIVGEDQVTIGSDFPAMQFAGSLTAMLERSVEKYPEIFRPYVDVHGNEIEGHYIDGLDGIASWPLIPAVLLDAGLSEGVVRKVCGENWISFLARQMSTPLAVAA